jgi:hypothetical protein
VIGALLGNYATVKERKMRNSIVPAVILCALLTTSRTNGGDICLDDGPSAGLCCFQGSKDWPKLNWGTDNELDICVDVLDVEALAVGLAARDHFNTDLRPATILALAAGVPIRDSAAATSWHYAVIQPPATDFGLDAIRLDFTDRPLGFGISIEKGAELICAGIVSAQVSYASAAFNIN